MFFDFVMTKSFIGIIVDTLATLLDYLIHDKSR